MNQLMTCPVCKTDYPDSPELCGKCGFPFAGTDKEKSSFIGQQILKKGKITDTQDSIKRARIILWVVGTLNILSCFFFNARDPLYLYYVVAGAAIGVIFIGFGFLAYKKPFLSILIPLVLLLAVYLLQIVDDPGTILEGIVWKVIFLSGLSYGLINIIRANKIRKESEFLEGQAYK